MNTLTTRQRAALALALMFGMLIVGLTVQAAGDGPPTRVIPYQGRLELNGNPPSGVHDLTFTLWDDPVAGTELFTETIVDVPVAGGAFSVVIGDGAGLPDTVYTAAELFLSIAVDGTGLAGRQAIFASHRVVDPPGEFSTGKLNVTSQAGGAAGWRIAADLVGATAAIRHQAGAHQLGLHQNGNLYLSTLDDPDGFAHTMVVEKQPVANDPGALGHGRLSVGGLNLGADSTGIGAIQYGTFGNCDGGGGLANPATLNFPTPFDTEPVVVVSINEEDQAGCTELRLEGVTPTGFTVRSWALGSASACGCVEYIAIAP